MQAVGAALPEFHANRRQHVTTPIRGAFDLFIFKLRFALAPLAFQLGPVFQRRALIGSPGPDLAAPRAAVEIRFRLRIRHFADRAGDTNLPFLLRPVKYQGCLRVFGQFAPFSTIVIGEENEPAFIQAFEQHNSCRRPALSVGGGQDHRIEIQLFDSLDQVEPLVNLDEEPANSPAFSGTPSLVEPSAKLRQGVLEQIAATQPREVIFSSEISNRHGPGCYENRQAESIFVADLPVRTAGPIDTAMRCANAWP